MAEQEVTDLEEVFAGARRRGIGIATSIGRAVAAGDMVGLVIHPDSDSDDDGASVVTCCRVDQSLVERVGRRGSDAGIDTFSVSAQYGEILYGAGCFEPGMRVAVRCPEREKGRNVIQCESQDGGGIAGAVGVPKGWSVWAHRKHGICVAAPRAILRAPQVLAEPFVIALQDGYAHQQRQLKARADRLWDQVRSPAGMVLAL